MVEETTSQLVCYFIVKTISSALRVACLQYSETTNMGEVCQGLWIKLNLGWLAGQLLSSSFKSLKVIVDRKTIDDS